MPITPTEKIWVNGSLVDWDKATTHVLSHTLHYGTGAFEGIRAYKTSSGPSVFRLRDHMVRLTNSCKILMVDLPYSVDQLVEATKDVVRVNDLENGCYIRPLVFLGYGEMGINPLNSPVETIIAAWPWGAYLGDEGVENGVKMKISSWNRHHPNVFPTGSKTVGAYVNSSLAKVEALKAGYDEAIMLGTDGRISECSGENLFIVRDGVLITPPSSEAGALAGITLNSVVQIAKDLGYEVRYESLRRDDLYICDEAFLTGTAAEVVPIGSVDDRAIGTGKPGPITKKIQSTYASAVRGEIPAYEAWLDRV